MCYRSEPVVACRMPKTFLLALLSLPLSTAFAEAPGKPYIGAHGGAYLVTKDIGPDLGGRLGYELKLAKVIGIGAEAGVRSVPDVIIPWIGAQASLSLGPIGINPFIHAGFTNGETLLEFGMRGGLPIPMLGLYFSGTQVGEEIVPAVGIDIQIKIPPG